MYGIDKVFRVGVHQEQVVTSLNLDLVLQVHGDTCDLLVELLPVDAFALFTSTIYSAVGELFSLSLYTPLHKVMNVGKLVERRRRSVVNNDFPVIHSGVLLILKHQELLACHRRLVRPHAASRIIT